MEPVQVLICLAFGTICAVIASSRGRSSIGWFLLGFFFACFALIILLVIPDLKEEQARWDKAKRDQRRLKERLKQEQMKNAAFQEHVRGRLDHHDDALGVDTRNLLGSDPEPDLLDHEADLLGQGMGGTVPPPPPTGRAQSGFESTTWYVQTSDSESQSVSFSQLQMLYANLEIDSRTLVWCAGMPDWQPLGRVPGLEQALS
ncbi:MAG: DUF4339 domain-containing protein [Planctomycetota bacterium]